MASSNFLKSLNLLKTTNDYSTEKVGHALDCILFHTTGDVHCHREARKHGFGLGELFVQILKSLGHYFVTPKISSGCSNLWKISHFLWNYTNDNSDIGIELGKSGAFECIMQILGKLAKEPKSEWNTRCVNNLLGILHNSIRPNECIVANRSLYRCAEAVGILQNWTHSTVMILKVKSLLILSYITNEEESEIISRSAQAVEFLVNLLKKAVESTDHQAHVGTNYYSASELLKELSQLIIHDKNKEIVMENGGIVNIARMLQQEFSYEEQNMASTALLCLSFDDRVRKSLALRQSVRALRNLTLSEDKRVRSSSRRAIFEIENDEADEGTRNDGGLAAAARCCSGSTGGGHVMISYNWEHQETALKIRDELMESGYRVWIDVENMHGDTLECMAKAVAEADVLLLCMSQHYYASTSCRQEATYAAKKKKSIIPLIVEPGYQPEGWLDILIEAKLYYQFTSNEELRRNVDGLRKDLGSRGKLRRPEDATDAPIIPKRAELLGAELLGAAASSSSKCWSSQRVLQWFDEIKLPQLKSSLDFFEGADLEDLYNDSRDRSYDFKATCQESGLTAIEMRRLRSELRKLFQN